MDLKQIQGIIKDFEKSTMTSLELEMDGFKIKLSKQTSSHEVIKEVITPRDSSIRKEEPIEVKNVGFEVKSPLVGTYYSASSPKDEPFVKAGQRIEKGQTLCIIEAMKIMNEITAPISGIVENVTLKNGDPVGFDQVILSIV